jgi:hypothetical protein
MIKKAILFLVFSIVLSACGGEPVSTVEPAPLGTPTGLSASACSIPASWTVQFKRTGGIAGFNQSMTLQSDGSLKIQSENPPANVQKSISKSQIDNITNLLAQGCPFKMEPNDAGCADCFIYNLSVQMNGQTYTMLATDVTLTDQLRPLIDELSNLMQETK